jgi:hypothetical protein
VRSSKPLVLTLALVAAVVGPSRQVEAATIDFLGATVQYSWLYPDTSTILIDAPTNAVVGPGSEFIVFGQSFIPVDISATNITITWDLTSSPGFSSGTFNGPRFFDVLGAIAPITGVTINQSNLAGFDSSRIFFDADTIRLNFQSLQLQAGHTVVSLDVQFEQPAPALVPEPATIVMFGTGLLGVAMRFRERRIRNPRAI